MDADERVKVMNYLLDQGFAVVILGGDRERRFTQALESHDIYKRIINLMGKTSIKQAISILKHSQANILCNG